MASSSGLQQLSSSSSSRLSSVSETGMAEKEEAALKELWSRVFHAIVDREYADWTRQALDALPPFLRFEMPVREAQGLKGVEIRKKLDSEPVRSICHLQLSRMRLSALPPEISLFSNLKVLDFSSQNGLEGVTILPSSIGELSKLEKLDVSGNQLTTLPDSIGKLTVLKTLFASNNQLSQLPNSFCLLRSLEFLDLACNSLESLPDSIGNCEQLREIGLSSNRLTCLPPSFFSLKRLQKAFFSSNRFVEIPQQLMSMRLEVYAVDGNPVFTASAPCPRSPIFGSPPDLLSAYPSCNPELTAPRTSTARRQLFRLEDPEVLAESVQTAEKRQRTS